MSTALAASGGFVAGVLASLIAGLIVLAIERAHTRQKLRRNSEPDE